jgi:hypothetical protein
LIPRARSTCQLPLVNQDSLDLRTKGATNIFVSAWPFEMELCVFSRDQDEN